MYHYLSIFLLGGTLFTLLFHYARNNNTIVSSIIPAFPTLFLTGLLFTLYYDNNNLNYIKNSAFNFFITFLFCTYLYFMTVYSFNISFSIITGLFFYYLYYCIAFDYKILK